ncbi:MAG: PQQ-dependent dehydrogenase, methanol/ethanol family [Myxococcales bacterium]|nr:PQQ-dependent dehydrogenase, methanol/ethanol family [Myxococcales bacterium]
MIRLHALALVPLVLLACADPAVVEPAETPLPSIVDVIDAARLRGAESSGDDWLSHGRTYTEQRHSPLDRIHEGNVGELGLAWVYETRTTRGLEATPLVHDGVMYATGSWSVVFALDARTGVELWRHDPRVSGAAGANACCDVVNRGVALYDGRVYVGALDGRLIALDAKTGTPVWETWTVDPSKPYTITGAPRVVKGKVIIGNGGAELGVRGYVSAYDAATGALAWRFYTVPGDPTLPFEHDELEMAAHTWSGEWWTLGGGGTVWDSLAYDPELDLLYVGTGNGAPWVQSIRSPGGGDNLFLSSILALRPDTGELVWHYQTTPGESWDYTATQHMILADLEIDGRERKVLLQAPKNGFFYVLDRATGELLSAEKYAHVTWATRIDLATGRPVEARGARYAATPKALYPGPIGAHNWHPMSFNPATGLVYLPVQDMGFSFATDPDWQLRPGLTNTGIDPLEGTMSMLSGPVTGSLLAWDPVAQREVWRNGHVRPWNGGTLSTAGNLVFQGTGNATFAAYRATDGERLFEAPTGTGVVAPPMTYAIDGEQYVALLAGWGGGFALASGDPPSETLATGNRGRVLVFRLGGTLRLDVPEPTLAAVVPMDAPIDPQLAERGSALYHRYCGACHGPAAVGGGTIPDLRRSAPETLEALAPILLEGVFSARGMPNFGAWLTDADISALHAYLLEQRARLVADAER